MDEETKSLVANQARQIAALKERLALSKAKSAALTGELIKKRVDPDYLPE